MGRSAPHRPGGARVRWRGLVVLGFLLGLVGGVVLASVAVAARTATAYSRLVIAVGLDDARVLVPAARPAVADALPRLPGVVQSWVADVWVAQVEGPLVRYVFVVGGPGQPADLVHPVVVAGRAPHDDDPREVLVAEPAAADLHVSPGDPLTLHLLTPDEVRRFDSGSEEPSGAVVQVRVTGIARAPVWDGPLSSVIATPAFARAHRGEIGALAGFARLADSGPGTRKRFAEAVSEVGDAVSPAERNVYPRPDPTFPTSQIDGSMAAARTVLVGALAIFGAVLGIGGFLVVGQGLVRHHAVRPESQHLERALGMTRGERAAARAVAGSVGAVVAGLVAGSIALAAGLFEPLGSLARFEPSPGFRPPWTIALPGGTGARAGLPRDHARGGARGRTPSAAVAVVAQPAGQPARPAARSCWPG